MAYTGSDNSIPRVAVMVQNGQVICSIDSKTQKRFGPVLLESGRQGLHLFSVGYYLTSMAANYCVAESDSKTILRDIIQYYHPTLMAKLTINAKYKNVLTYFHRNSGTYLSEIVQLHNQLTKKFDLHDLEEYLNYSGALHHVFPCNVAHSENASDPKGGAESKRAIENLYSFSKNSSNKLQIINQNIVSITDPKVIQSLFREGFDDNNEWCLAFIILQVDELRKLYEIKSRKFLIEELDRGRGGELKDAVFNTVPFQAHPATADKAQFSSAYERAVKKIRSVSRR